MFIRQHQTDLMPITLILQTNLACTLLLSNNIGHHSDVQNDQSVDGEMRNICWNNDDIIQYN